MQATESTPPQLKQKSADVKILTDLNTVIEKMDLCASMLRPGDGSPAPSLKHDETLLAVIGFLEACAPRMVELVEAATLGALSEDTLVQCLTVNDRLQKLLSDVETVGLTETSATTTAASAPTSAESVDFDAFLDDDVQNTGDTNTNSVDPFGNTTDVLKPVPMGKTTGQEEENLKAAAASQDDEKKPAAAIAASQDDFDAFFEERTSSNPTD